MTINSKVFLINSFEDVISTQIEGRKAYYPDFHFVISFSEAENMKIWILTLLFGCVISAPSFEVHHRQTRSIASLLEDMINETGIRDLIPWIQEQIETEPALQRISEYLKSPAFARIEDHMRTCPGYQKVKDELKAEGVDLVEILHSIRNFITGGSDFYKSGITDYKIKPRNTLAELLDALVEKLDMTRVINIIHDKFHGNPDLKKVVDFLKSQTFKDINICMKENADVQDLLERLRHEDIDVDSLIDIVKSILSEHVFY